MFSYFNVISFIEFITSKITPQLATFEILKTKKCKKAKFLEFDSIYVC